MVEIKTDEGTYRVQMPEVPLPPPAPENRGAWINIGEKHESDWIVFMKIMAVLMTLMMFVIWVCWFTKP